VNSPANMSSLPVMTD